VSSFITNVYQRVKGGHFRLVPEVFFDGGYSPSIHGFGSLPNVLSSTFRECRRTLEEIEKKSDIKGWSDMHKDLSGGLVLFGGELDKPQELFPDVLAWSYFLVLTTGDCFGGCFLGDDEAIGIIADEELFLVKGAISPRSNESRQFAGITGSMKMIRQLLAGVRREETLYARPNATSRAASIPRAFRVTPHEDDSLASVGVDRPLMGKKL